MGKSAKRSPIKDSAWLSAGCSRSATPSPGSASPYLVAMLFVIFDIEVVYLYPCTTVQRNGRAAAATPSGDARLRSGILAIAYIYALKKGALDWKEREA
ncbi:MAG: NADH-quinone oxidoreductase subunit A [Verrucomicrobiales bacterium]